MNQQSTPGAINVLPIFFLRGIDPLEVKSLYETGFFETVELRPTNLTAVDPTKITTPTYGKDAFSPKYSFYDRASVPMVMCTTNVEAFDYFNSTGGKLKEGGRCDWCKQDFPGRRYGAPIHYEQVYLQVPDTSGQSRQEIRPTFWIDGECHSYRCALADLNRQMNQPARGREPGLGEREAYLRYMYFLETGCMDLRPSPHPSLHELNGGSLSQEEFDDPKTQYLPTCEPLCIPAKHQYLAMRRQI